MNNEFEINFSVLITIYYKENPIFFKEAIDSILVNQTLKPKQIVIVKDGPLTLELDKAIDRYLKEYKDVFKIVSLEKNMKQGFAANVGGKYCENEFIARMDADDIAFPDRFEKQFKHLIDNDLDIVGGQLLEFVGSKKNIVSERKVPKKHEDIVSMLKYRMPVSNPTIIYKKKVFDDINGYDGKSFPEDYDFFVRAYLKRFKFGNVKDNILFFRLGENIDDVLKRRHGYQYAKNEFKLMRKFYRIGFYNFFEFLKIIIIKIPVRLLPFKVFKFLYYRLFRKL
ncbi:glycosyltransferase [Tenacibaculum dicentrarchi]|nr:glycosyltransferase [Tenacibaculum dicentrarchi]MDB0615196.1 glycosyltransferase [Tenacibaculum dicentrarchi]